MTVINNIKKARLEKNVLQEDLAKSVNCSLRSISRYETGERCPSLEMALRLSKYFQLDVNDLFDLEPDLIPKKGAPKRTKKIF